VEVYPRPDGTIYICGIGGSDYISTEQLKLGAFREQCIANPQRAQAAIESFQQMSSNYKNSGVLQTSQACMRPCPPDANPYMGSIPNYSGAYINAGHNCWYVIPFFFRFFKYSLLDEIKRSGSTFGITHSIVFLFFNLKSRASYSCFQQKTTTFLLVKTIIGVLHGHLAVD
jgi:FAD dependent oxidoreductase